MKSKLMGAFSVAFVVFFLMTGCTKADADANSKQQPVAEKAVADAPIYKVNLTMVDGSTKSMADFKGKVIIVDFWDTWCPPCRMEIPHFVDLYNEYKDDGLVIVGAAFGRQGKEAVAQFAVDYKINYFNSIANQALVDAFGEMPASIPTTYIIDTKGKVAKKYVGYNDKSVFEEQIKTLLSL